MQSRIMLRKCYAEKNFGTEILASAKSELDLWRTEFGVHFVQLLLSSRPSPLLSLPYTVLITHSSAIQSPYPYRQH